MKVHVLRGQDTLQSLSAQYHIPACMIARANDLSLGWRAGRKIQIPPPDYCQTGGDTLCQEDDLGEYLVQPGDTVFGIAERFSVPMRWLMEENGMNHPVQLAQKKKLRIPKLPHGCFLYTVQAADTLRDICCKFGLEEGEVRRQNRLEGTVYPGMQLILKGECK